MSSLAGLSIRNKALAFLALTLVLFGAYRIAYHAGLRQLQQEAARRGERVSSALFVPVEKYSYFPEMVGIHPVAMAVLRDSGNAARVQQANDYLEKLNQIARAEVIYLLNPDGVTIASSNWNTDKSFVGHNYGFRPYFQDAIAGRVGRFYAMGATSRTPGYYISHPVTEDGKITGVAVVKVDLSNFDREWKPGDDYEVTITDEYGISFLSSQADWKYRPLEPLPAAHTARLASTRQYEGILRPPLPIVEQSSLGPDVRFVIVSQQAEGSDANVKVPYLAYSSGLPSNWRVNVFMQAGSVHGQALLHTFAFAILISFILVLALYWRELRRRGAEREMARLTLEAAHAELESKHSQLQALSEEYHRASITDALTGSYNRRFFMEVTAKMISGTTRHKVILSVIVIDVDHFKSINDQYGHYAGDYVLKRISEICSSELREEDVFARMGGEEFVIALMHASYNDATDVAERLRSRIMAQHFEVDGHAFHVTISCGVAQYQLADAHIENTIRRADRALYQAKHQGRNQVALAHLN